MKAWPDETLYRLRYMPYGLFLGMLLVGFVIVWVWGTWRIGAYFWKRRGDWPYVWLIGGAWGILAWYYVVGLLAGLVIGLFPFPPLPNRGNFTCSDVMISEEEIQTLFPGWKMLDQWVSHKRHEDYYGTTWNCTRFFSPYQGEVTTLEQLEALRRTEPFIVVTIYRFSDIFGPKVPWAEAEDRLKDTEAESQGMERAFHSRNARVWRFWQIDGYLFEGVYEEFYVSISFDLPPERGTMCSPYTEEKVLRLVQLEDQKIGRFIERTQPTSVRQQVEP